MVLSFTPRFRLHQRSKTSFTESAFTSVLIPSCRSTMTCSSYSRSLSNVGAYTECRFPSLVVQRYSYVPFFLWISPVFNRVRLSSKRTPLFAVFFAVRFAKKRGNQLSLDTIERICEALDISLSEFFAETVPK